MHGISLSELVEM